MIQTNQDLKPINYPEDVKKEKKGASLETIVKRIVIGLVAVIVGVYLIGFVLALIDSEKLALVIKTLRDLTLILLMGHMILIGIAIAILILQFTRFINLLGQETKPILDETLDTVQQVKATTEFAAKHTVGPIIGFQVFMAGLGRFTIEIVKIWRIVKPSKD
ncbi:hypothetical protein MASR2M15_23130 [Anaerolineales bacterium]